MHKRCKQWIQEDRNKTYGSRSKPTCCLNWMICLIMWDNVIIPTADWIIWDSCRKKKISQYTKTVTTITTETTNDENSVFFNTTIKLPLPSTKRCIMPHARRPQSFPPKLSLAIRPQIPNIPIVKLGFKPKFTELLSLFDLYTHLFLLFLFS